MFLEGCLAALLRLSLIPTPTAPLTGFQDTDIVDEFVLVAGGAHLVAYLKCRATYSQFCDRSFRHLAVLTMADHRY